MHNTESLVFSNEIFDLNSALNMQVYKIYELAEEDIDLIESKV